MGGVAAEVNLLWYVWDLGCDILVKHRAYEYVGKILQDANTVESYKIEEKGFIVCMFTKVLCTSVLH